MADANSVPATDSSAEISSEDADTGLNVETGDEVVTDDGQLSANVTGIAEVIRKSQEVRANADNAMENDPGGQTQKPLPEGLGSFQLPSGESIQIEDAMDRLLQLETLNKDLMEELQESTSTLERGVAAVLKARDQRDDEQEKVQMLLEIIDSAKAGFQQQSEEEEDEDGEGKTNDPSTETPQDDATEKPVVPTPQTEAPSDYGLDDDDLDDDDDEGDDD